MASSNENVSMALFCDFENVALGVRDANYEKFDIKPVLERLLLKGSIVVKKAYCDWDRYKAFKAPMHEGNFELIEIPHVRQSGKNSADIRMVVDALDLCYTKSHVNTFVIISGDSDFSPLVSKLRENNKKVIGVGVKQSTSDLLVANCDEFIFYDDLVRESRRMAAKRDPREAPPAVKRTPEEEKRRRDDMDKRRSQAVEMAVETFDALVSERGDSGKIWASVLKEAIKRRKPDFSESYYGFRTFGNLLEEAKARGLLEFGRDEKSGAYVYRSSGTPSGASGESAVAEVAVVAAAEPAEGRQEGRRGRSRGGRKQGERKGFPHASNELTEEVADELQLAAAENAFAEAEAVQAADDADATPIAAPQTDSDYDAAEAAEDAARDAAANGNVAPRNGQRNEPRNEARNEKRKSPPKKPARAVKAAQVKAVQVNAVQTPAVAASPWQQFAPVPEHAPEPVPVEAAPAEAAPAAAEEVVAAAPAKSRARAPAKGRGKAAVSRISAVAAEAAAATEAPLAAEPAPAAAPAPADEPAAVAEAEAAQGDAKSSKPRGPRRPRKPAAKAA